ncbi:MAG: hypothetical protein E6R03_04230 [Hyphomicrobiaceae bacterium]|nr:MAG: hypothetical protein E6R03_04230 [Hyphomicrobiaceae bacterium]
MNKLVYNYLARVLRVVNSRSLDVEIDFGLRRYEQVRLQLIRTDWSSDGKSDGYYGRAKVCLTELLMSKARAPLALQTAARTSEPIAGLGSEETEPQVFSRPEVGCGRQIIVSPGQPNAYNKFTALTYLRCESLDHTRPAMTITRGNLRFLSVVKVMEYLSQHDFDVGLAQRIVEDFAIQDQAI